MSKPRSALVVIGSEDPDTQQMIAAYLKERFPDSDVFVSTQIPAQPTVVFVNIWDEASHDS